MTNQNQQPNEGKLYLYKVMTVLAASLFMIGLLAALIDKVH